MKHRVRDLEGALLDAAVARANGWIWQEAIPVSRDNSVEIIAGWGPPTRAHKIRPNVAQRRGAFSPSSYWEEGGPIVEREHIAIEWEGDLVEAACRWTAGLGDTEAPGHQGWSFGPTPLVAAMRMYVYSKFGEEVEL